MSVTQAAGMFSASPFLPVTLGFFGLGTGYLIYGPQELTGRPVRDAAVDRANGMWGIFMPGLCQLLTGIYLFVGMTWFQVFTSDAAVYMAALAFSAYGIHWFALGWNRYRQSDPRPNGYMSIPFVIISVLGLTVFFGAGAWPVGVLFTGLALVYIAEFFASFGVPGGERALGLAHVVVGVWLMYLTFATTLNIASGFHLPGG